MVLFMSGNLLIDTLLFASLAGAGALLTVRSLALIFPRARAAEAVPRPIPAGASRSFRMRTVP